jgi:hypothetical protein
MTEHRGVEYTIRWKIYGWEWEVFAHSGGTACLVHGTVVSLSQNLADDEWRQIAIAGVEATVDVLLSKQLVIPADRHTPYLVPPM